jgi:hypothetical protein
MLANWGNWIEAGIGASSAASIEQVALAYLMVSLLAPLSWVLLVEICRRTRTSRLEGSAAGNAAGESSGAGLRPAAQAARLAMPMARWRKPLSANW